MPNLAEFRPIIRSKEFTDLEPENKLSAFQQVIASRDEEFRALPPDSQTRVAQQLLDEAMKPTTGEKLFASLEAIAVPAAATAGGLAFAPAGPLASAIGAGLGGATGQAVVEAARPFLTDEQTSIREGLENTLRVGAVSAATDAIAGKVVRIGGAGIERLRKSAIGGDVEIGVRLAHEKLKEFGSGLLAGQLTGERQTWLNFVYNVSRNSIGGSGTIGQKLTGQQDAIKSLTNTLLDDLGSQFDSKAITRAVFSNPKGGTALDVMRGMWREVQRAGYDRVRELDPRAVVKTDTIVEFFRDAIQKGGKNMERAIDAAFPPSMVYPNGWRSALQTEIPSQPGRFMGMQATPAFRINEVSFSDAVQARSHLLEIGRRPAASLEDQATINTARKLASMLDEQITSATASLTPDALAAWRSANRVTRAGYEKFEGELIRGLVDRVKDEPSNLVSELLKPNNKDVLDAVKRALSPAFGAFASGRAQISRAGQNLYETVLQPKLASGLLEQAADRVVDPSTGAFVLGPVNPGKLEQVVKQLGNTVEAAFGRGAESRIAEIANLLNVTANKTTEGPGKMWIQLAQGAKIGAVGTAAAELVFAPISKLTGIEEKKTRAGLVGTAVVFLVTPAAMARVFAKQSTTEALIHGLKQPSLNKRAFARFITQASALMPFRTRNVASVADLPGIIPELAGELPESMGADITP